jgi:prepilin-type N-terminal cleavage/methylation domain-containing protein
MAPSRAEHGFTIIDMLVAVTLLSILMAGALPAFDSALAAHRLTSDARGLAQNLAVAKMRAASRFTRTRLYVDRNGRRYFTQTWNKTTSQWDSDDAISYLSSGVSFDFGSLDEPPPNTQTEIGLSAECLDTEGEALANTSCITFNSRGIPITSVGEPTGGNAFYLTDGSLVYGTTITAVPLIRLWRSPATVEAWTEE